LNKLMAKSTLLGILKSNSLNTFFFKLILWIVYYPQFKAFAACVPRRIQRARILWALQLITFKTHNYSCIQSSLWTHFQTSTIYNNFVLHFVCFLLGGLALKWILNDMLILYLPQYMLWIVYVFFVYLFTVSRSKS